MIKYYFAGLIITALLLVSCESHDEKIVKSRHKHNGEYYINDYAYNLYDADNAPLGSFVMDWEPKNIYWPNEIDKNGEESPTGITADFETCPRSYYPGEWWPYKQIGKVENGRVKIVLLPLDFDSFPDEKIK